MNTKDLKKTARKQAKIKHLAKSEGIELSEKATVHLLVGNVGLVTGATRESLATLFGQFGKVKAITLIPKKQYSFITYESPPEAQLALNTLQGKEISLISNTLTKMCLSYVETVAAISLMALKPLPSGLILVENYINQDYEKHLLNFLDSNLENTKDEALLKHRRVKHYGYEFNYDSNDVDKDAPLLQKIPDVCFKFLERLLKDGLVENFPDQLTVNIYEPGQGIPSHIDTHSAFDDKIISLSLNAATIMDFRHPDGEHVPVLLRPRSILIMNGESRYVWSHGITPRKTDIVPDNEGITLAERGTRVSFTFRRIRLGPCLCSYHRWCDSRNKDGNISKNVNLEKLYVQDVYESIAPHFNLTRHTPWPMVAQFLKSLSPGSFVIDVGCGNGKYFNLNKSIFELGFDASETLMGICHRKNCEVFSGDLISLPLRHNIADACICIAVIHHLATEMRRQKALENLVELLRPGGKALVYVWALEQELSSEKFLHVQETGSKKIFSSSSSSISNNINPTAAPDDVRQRQISCYELAPALPLPVHVNGTPFKHQDILVPWHLKGKKSVLNDIVHHRFYHLFQEGELERLCSNIPSTEIVNRYYDRGNWCLILRKQIINEPT